MTDTHPIQCRCGSTDNVLYGTAIKTCEKCQVKMSLIWKDVEESKELGEKCYDVGYYSPYGGATSFSDIDAYAEASEAAYNVNRVKTQFDGIYDNIQSDGDMSTEQKTSAIENATKEMIKRIQHPKEQKSFKDKVVSLFTSNTMMGNNVAITLGSFDPIPIDNRFIVTKDVDGQYRWLAIFSNKFQDKDKETISEDAHKEYEQWVDETKQYPEARIWHIPGTGFGSADFVTYNDGFTLASGTFYKGFEDVAEKLAGMENLGLSHGFVYKPEEKSKDGVYQRYRTFEISVLPLEKAANPWTAFTLDLLKEEVKMGFTAEKRDFLAKTLGEERVGKLESVLPQLNKDLEDAGIGWKEFVEAMEPKTEVEPEKGETKVEGDSATGSEGTGTVDTKELAETFKAVVMEAMAPVNAAIAEIKTDITELQKYDDDKIAAKLEPKTNISQITSAGRPSESADNVIDDEKAKGLDQADKGENEGSAVAAARQIVDELMLGKRAAG